uniref:Kinesin motor domain-containing protein n=1 Tax=Chromera velia CCMP2878 TaxID=1169474 RepID=A0A0G4GZX2_9ALVE|eukprot:Cvel_24084.t1-p1 / transcript=Cvel_24084.t1 / gene=Cvel_24084 / organism=Chromera_velia_CCMP2878 / gene_product=hypothetical protein / transcript_product=hypothetical protein / location=Cvel_scaffold2566:15260-18171(-) / protein_length=369 / sequence_SO=supercontig / SO=protein_coding / is_pseudo=false
MSMYNVVPIIPSEVKPSTADLSKNVCVFHPESVLSSNGAQRSDFFATVGAPCVAAVVEAQKSSVFVTLGGTGTGKSHTLFGDLSADLSGSSDGGVASQALSHLFREVLRGEGEAVFGKKEGGGEGKGGWGGDYGTNNNNSSNPGCALSHFGTASSTSLGRGVGVGESVGECPFLVEMVFLEVLGGSVIDLLKAPEARRQLAVVKDRFGLFSVNGLSRTQVSSETEALSLLRCSLSQRSVESLPTNSRTSRGHSMLSVVVTKRATGQRAALSFVDVATAMALSSAGAPSDPVSQAISDSLQALRLIISQIVHFPVLPELDELDEECRNSVFSSLAYWKSRGVWSPLGEEISYEDSVLSKLLKPIFSCPNT